MPPLLYHGQWQGGDPCEQLLPAASDCVAERLCAAKPVTWRGRGDLVQVPLPSVAPGLILLVELWASISGAVIALLCLGCRVIVCAAECDPLACAASQAVMPNIVHAPRVEMVSASLLRVPIKSCAWPVACPPECCSNGL